MAKDRVFFILSIVFLGFIAAFLFKDGDKIPINTAQEQLAAAKTPQETAPKEVAEKEPEIKPIHIAFGKRAIPFEINKRFGLIQFMKPGMYVDIGFNSKSNVGFGAVNLTLLKNIRILAIGSDQKMDDAIKAGMSNRLNAPLEVLLEMTPKQAEIFSYAIASGEVTLEFMHHPQNEDNVLINKLMDSKSTNDFHSILVTHMIQQLFPGIDVFITATPKGYIAAGKVPDPQKAAKIIEVLMKLAPEGENGIVNLLEVIPQQILLAVKFVEVDCNVSSRLGLNWKVLFDHDCSKIGLGAYYPLPPVSDPDYFLFGKNIKFGDFKLSMLINMLQENDGAKVLAEPNLTTTSGKTAHFFAGGEFPILIPQGGPLLGTVTVEYKKYGVMLDFTPTVDLNGLITLHVYPEVSTIDKGNAVILSGYVIPSLISRKAETTVKLWPGQSYIIAGLIQDELLKVDTHLYGLHRLPIIGPLFTSKKFLNRKSELMIMVTPYLMGSEQCEQYTNCRPETMPCNDPRTYIEKYETPHCAQCGNIHN